MTFRSAAAGLAAIVLLLGFAAPAVSQSNELQEAQQLLRQGQTDRAMERVDHYLKTRPKDARGHFMRGIVLTEQNKPGDENLAVVTFDQDYTSSNISNKMRKRQYWQREHGVWRIVHEGAA